MLTEKSKIKVHLYSGKNEIITRNHNKIFEVYKKGGKLGIDWNTAQSPYSCGGEVFSPFETFASTVIFEDVETQKTYHYSNLTQSVEPMEV